MNIENISKEDQINRILENMPAELDLIADMPSGGRFYKKKNEDMPITVRAMNFDDEKIIADASRKNADPVNTMLERCVKNINVKDLYVFDKLALLLKVREATYGPSYDFTQKCSACGFESPVSFDLNNIIMNEVPDDFNGEEEILLPVLQKKAIIRHPKVSEEHYVTDLSHRNLWRFVVSIDGVVKKDILAEVIKKMPLRDIHAMVKEIGGTKYGFSPMFKFQCPECGEEEVLTFPINADFFYMS